MLLALVAAPASAEPLCRDLKGLYTPCPPATGVRPTRGMMAAPRAIDPDAPPQAERPARVRTVRPPALQKGRLCRDAKGLMTPCAR